MTEFDTAAASPAARLAIFTDFDGTLVEIAETPDAVNVPGELVSELERAAHSVGSALAIVSGREVADIDRKLAPAVLPVAGSHGAHRRGGDGRRHDLTEDFVEAAARIAERLEPFAVRHDGILLEAKSGTVALHYRQAPDLRADCQRAMLAAIEPELAFRVMEGKMVYEARPVTIGKGAAVRAFMDELPFAGRIPIFIGDDTTDEEGFLAVQNLGGVGIKVGDGDSVAQARLPDVQTVRAFIRRIANGALFEAIAARSQS